MRSRFHESLRAKVPARRPLPDEQPNASDGKAGRRPASVVACLLACTALLLAACSASNTDNLLADGKRLLEKNDRRGAELQFKNVLKEQPNNAEARFQLGQLTLEAWDFATAEKELRRAWETGYDANKVGPLLARALLELGQPDKVLSDINPATLNDPVARALLDSYRARALLAKGNVEEAKAMADAVLRASPQLAAAAVTQAQVLVHGKDLNVAAQIIDGVLAKYPTEIDALVLRARIAGAQGQYGVAQARLAEAVAAAPAAVWPRIALVTMLFAAERYDEVRQQVALLHEVPGGDLEATLLDAQLAFKENKYQEAREAVALVLKVVPEHVQALLLAGTIELTNGSPEVAEAHLSKVVERSPRDSRARRLLADARLRLGKPDAARAALEPILQSSSADALTLALGGQIEMQRGDFARAKQLFKRAAEADPQDGQMRAALAQAQIRSGDVTAGIGTLQELGASDRSQYASEVMLVLTHLEQGDPDKALRAVTALEAKQPRNPLTFNLRGVVLLRKRDVPGARQAFEAALAIDPQYTPSTMNLVNLDLAEGNADGAGKRLEALLARQPNNPEGLLALAELKAHTGSGRPEVIALVEKAVAANAEAVLPRIALIRWYLAGGEVGKALDAAQAAKTKFPRHDEITSLLGRAQLASGDAQQAVTTLREVIATQDRVAAVHFQLAQAQLAAGDPAGARQSLKRTLELEPQNAAAKMAQIRLEMRAGSRAVALDLARSFQKSYPKLADGYLAEGDILLADKRYAQASALFRKALTVAPSAIAAVRLHQSMAAGGNPADAAQFAQTWVTEHPKDGDFRAYLAERLIESRDFDGAKGQLATVIALQPANALALNNLAWISLETKDPRALEYAEKAYQLAPGDPRILDTLGAIRLERGELAPAVDLLSKARQLAPKSPTIGFHYASALAKSGRRGDALRELEQILGSGQTFPEEQEARRLLNSL